MDREVDEQALQLAAKRVEKLRNKDIFQIISENDSNAKLVIDKAKGILLVGKEQNRDIETVEKVYRKDDNEER